MTPDLLTDYESMILLAILAAGGRAHGAAVTPRWTGWSATDSWCPRAARPRRGAVAPRRAFEVTPAGLRAIERKQHALVSLWADLPELADEPLVGDLVWEHGAHRLQTWLWYLAQRV